MKCLKKLIHFYGNFLNLYVKFQSTLVQVEGRMDVFIKSSVPLFSF